MKTVAVFGDSILKGVVNNGGHYTVSKNSFVKICEEKFKVQIFNKAKFGSTVADGEILVEKSNDLIINTDSQYVFIEFGGNDCDFDWQKVSDNIDQVNKPHVCLEAFRSSYCRLINNIKEFGKTPVMLSLPPIDSTKYFNWISIRFNGEKIKNFLKGNIKFLEDWHERYNLEVFDIARTTGTELINISSPFLEYNNYSDLLCIDGIHPNEDGHKLIAGTIIKSLIKENENI